MEEDLVFCVEQRSLLTFHQVFVRTLRARALRTQTNFMRLGILFVKSAKSILGGATLGVSSLMRTDQIGGRNRPTSGNSFTLDVIL